MAKINAPPLEPNSISKLCPREHAPRRSSLPFAESKSPQQLALIHNIMAPADQLPLQSIFTWKPFRLDALGLVTLLGADEVSRAIGGLQHSWLTEYLPLMGAFMIAGNRFTEPLPGYTAYNITDGIIPPELNGPFTRWINNHIYSGPQREANTTILTWSLALEEEVHISWRRELPALLIGLCLNSALLVMTVLMADWYGMANSLGMILSVIVRWILIRQNRLELRKLAAGARRKLKAGLKAHTDLKKMLVEPPNSGKIVVNYIPGALITCFLLPLDKPHQTLYRSARFVGWVAFGVHVISIGQSSLVAQLMTIAIMTFGTMAAIYRVGCDETEFGHFLRAETKVAYPLTQQRRDCFVELEPTLDEENALKSWSLMPLESNRAWFTDYGRRKELRRAGKPLSDATAPQGKA